MLSTGTVSGVAGFSEDAASLYLKPGDVIEAEIERIGVLRNPVVAGRKRTASRRPSACAGELVLKQHKLFSVPLDQALLQQRRERLVFETTRSPATRP